MIKLKFVSTPLASHYKLNDKNISKWWKNGTLWML